MKCLSLFAAEKIPLDNVPSRYTRHFLPALNTTLGSSEQQAGLILLCLRTDSPTPNRGIIMLSRELTWFLTLRNWQFMPQNGLLVVNFAIPVDWFSRQIRELCTWGTSNFRQEIGPWWPILPGLVSCLVTACLGAERPFSSTYVEGSDVESGAIRRWATAESVALRRIVLR
jgi:hypothetical protein